MATELPIVRYHRADRRAVCTFLREALALREADRLLRQWEWKYDGNPFNPNGEPYVLLRKDGKRIVGMYGSIFLRFWINGQEHLVSHGCDLAIHPAYRGRRLSEGLMERRRTDNPVNFAWRNEISNRIATVAGRTGVRFVPMVKPLHVGSLLRGIHSPRWLGRAGAIGARGFRQLCRPLSRRTAPGRVAVRRVYRVGTEVDELWERACRDYPVILVRDAQYLDWRFVQRPDAQYTILVAVEARRVVGYMVVRSTDKGGVHWGYLVDYLVERRSRSLFSLLLGQAIEHLRRQGVSAISCRVTVPHYRPTLYRHGFVPWRFGVPGYIHAGVDVPMPALRGFEDIRRWFVTMGDGDLEMSQ
jgi:GNAT superfamily N-acetyltransferase